MNFSELDHRYTKGGVEFVPVTKFLERFKPTFQKEMVAAAVAKKHGRTAEDVLSQWELNAAISCDYGNSIHKGVEYWIRFGEVTKLPHVAGAVKKFGEKYDRIIIKPEIVVDDESYKIAGTIDQLHILGPKIVGITDIKTNGELSDESKGYFLAPLDKLPFSKINEYRLQLSMYKHLLERKKFDVRFLRLEHWNGQEFTTIELEPINVESLLLTI